MNTAFMNNGFVNIPSMNSCMFAKGHQEMYSEPETNHNSVASYSPVRTFQVDPTDLISYDAPVSAFCRQFSQAPAVNQKVNVDNFFAQQVKQAAPAIETENDRLMKLNQRKALLELALADTLNEIKGY
jgi:hypothetical protein